jgi:hypothetical protein
MPMSTEDKEFINEHVSNTIVWFVGLPLSVIIVLLGIIVYKIW